MFATMAFLLIQSVLLLASAAVVVAIYYGGIDSIQRETQAIRFDEVSYMLVNLLIAATLVSYLVLAIIGARMRSGPGYEASRVQQKAENGGYA